MISNVHDLLNWAGPLVSVFAAVFAFRQARAAEAATAEVKISNVLQEMRTLDDELSNLHGNLQAYQRLFDEIREHRTNIYRHVDANGEWENAAAVVCIVDDFWALVDEVKGLPTSFRKQLLGTFEPLPQRDGNQYHLIRYPKVLKETEGLFQDVEQDLIDQINAEIQVREKKKSDLEKARR